MYRINSPTLTSGEEEQEEEEEEEECHSESGHQGELGKLGVTQPIRTTVGAFILSPASFLQTRAAGRAAEGPERLVGRSADDLSRKCSSLIGLAPPPSPPN